jgi:hypothetical protein
MISIEGLLEDEQGLSMGEMLTVKIRQPSQERRREGHHPGEERVELVD